MKKFFYILFLLIPFPSHAQLYAVDTVGSDTVYSVYFKGQLPKDPGVYDARATSPGTTLSVEQLTLRYSLPAGGVNAETAIIFTGPGVGESSDVAPFWHSMETLRPYIGSNFIFCTVNVRNLKYMMQADHVKLQITDVCRAIGYMQSHFNYNRRRQYFFGGSGAGWLAMQLAMYIPEQFAEIHSHAGIMKLTTPTDKATKYPNDPWGGWNVNTSFATSQGSLSTATWNRIEAERALRGPLLSMQHNACAAKLWGVNAPLVLMTHGTSDTIVDKYHMLSMKEALETYTGQSSILKVDDSWHTIWQQGNWNFAYLKGVDHFYDRPFWSWEILAELGIQCFTRVKNADPPSTVDYTSPTSNGYAFHLHGTLEEAVIETESTTAAEGWQMYE